MGAIDASGVAVSMIQSLYFEFGSDVFYPKLEYFGKTGWNALRPGRKPFHTLNPALARFDDGRTMIYGTMGGEGQPQTLAATVPTTQLGDVSIKPYATKQLDIGSFGQTRQPVPGVGGRVNAVV